MQGGRGGQAGAVLQVEVQGAVTVHDHAFIARSLSVIHRGQRADVHITAQEVAVHAGHRRNAFFDHQVFLHIFVARGRVVALLRHGIVDAGIAGNDEDVGLVAHCHEGDVVGAGRTGLLLLITHIVHLRTCVGCRGGGLRTERHTGEQSHGKERDLLHVYEKDLITTSEMPVVC